MAKFYATIEYLKGQKAAIVTVTDSKGEWAGACRIETKRTGHYVRPDLYEQGYTEA